MIRLAWLTERHDFPPVERALAQPNGLLAAGGDLAPERLLQAYSRGIFPWFAPGEPLLWWSPDPRMVLQPERVRVRRSLDKVLRNRPWEVRCNTAFEQVMRACAAPRDAEGGTWITDGMVAAYGELHRRGFAHSIETWMDGELVGGLYGVALGRMFFGESMFSHRTDASKIALVQLCAILARHGYPLIDCQMHTGHLARMGAEQMARVDFCRLVAELVAQPAIIRKWDFVVRSPAEGGPR